MTESPFAEPRHVADPKQCTFYHSMNLPGFGEVHGNFDLPIEFPGIGCVDTILYAGLLVEQFFHRLGLHRLAAAPNQ